MQSRRIIHTVVVTLALAQVLLILVSWLVTAAWPDLPMRSLLSSEGIRWLFGTFTRNLLTPVLVWLIFGCMAYGTVVSSGLTELRRPFTFREHSALRFVGIEIVLFIAVLLLLTLIPHAPLLSVTGQLFPSSFSDGIVVFTCIALMVIAVTFGLTTGRFQNLSAVLDALVSGISRFARLWLIYILAAELFASIRYFGGI